MTFETASAEELERKLTEAYVALAMTRKVAVQGFSPTASDSTVVTFRSLVSLVDVASNILEEILDPNLLGQANQNVEVAEIEMLM